MTAEGLSIPIPMFVSWRVCFCNPHTHIIYTLDCISRIIYTCTATGDQCQLYSNVPSIGLTHGSTWSVLTPCTCAGLKERTKI